jgi:hypothetical protein
MHIIHRSVLAAADAAIAPGTLFQSRYGGEALKTFLKLAAADSVLALSFHPGMGLPAVEKHNSFQEHCLVWPEATLVLDEYDGPSRPGVETVGSILVFDASTIVVHAASAASDRGHLIDLNTGATVAEDQLASRWAVICPMWSIYGNLVQDYSGVVPLSRRRR